MIQISPKYITTGGPKLKRVKNCDRLIWVRNTDHIKVGDIVQEIGKRSSKVKPRMIVAIFPKEKIGFFGEEYYPIFLRR